VLLAAYVVQDLQYSRRDVQGLIEIMAAVSDEDLPKRRGEGEHVWVGPEHRNQGRFSAVGGGFVLFGNNQHVLASLQEAQ